MTNLELEQTERLITALERIADALEKLVDVSLPQLEHPPVRIRGYETGGTS